MAIDKEQVWNKGQMVPNEGEEYKYESTTDDVKPAKLYKHSRENTQMAWEIDHIFPRQILEKLGVPLELIDHIDNLRPLHHSNNESKGTLFPNYTKVVEWNEVLGKNVPIRKNVSITEKTVKRLNNLYKDYLDGYSLEQIAKAYNRHK